ncbi:tumor necrosis factor receptor superfamily member 4 [Dromiciops gliroides]|uniref:tumor necrosis factor receptor superfamily member 4 n=1 Tax=Dromiciops gliroides TaxID=33562 RepID=UPI001CC394D0|nr:tumor necrosis factor receptor superfamily member 4 [Dromiciops gliroides]
MTCCNLFARTLHPPAFYLVELLVTENASEDCGNTYPSEAGCSSHPSYALCLASLQSCDKLSYRSDGKCCRYCEPGFQMVKRCTYKDDTTCKPCAKGLFNKGFSNDFCEPCTQCNVGTGSQVRKNCTTSSDTECQCIPGTQPVETFKWGVECTRCPPGHFSPGENTMCKPWTNCTAMGKRTLRAGSGRADADCEDARTSGPPRSPPTSSRTTTATSSSSTVHLRVTTQSLGTVNTLQPRPDKPWSLFLLIFPVLLVSALVVLGLGVCLSRQLPAIWKPPGTRPCPSNQLRDCTCATPGEFCHDSDCKNCRKHTCSPGQKVLVHGKFVFSFTCEDCGDGTYSDGTDGKCLPWTNCARMGFLTVRPGNRTHNVLCGMASPTASGVFNSCSIPVVVLTGLATLIFVLVIIQLVLYIQWVKKEPSTKDREPILPLGPGPPDDIGNCPFPEEEWGEKTAEDKAHMGHPWV